MKDLYKHVLFAGYYGMKNIGDDCFGLIAAWGARKYWMSQIIKVLSPKSLSITNETPCCLPEKSLFKGHIYLESVLQVLKSNNLIWAGGSIFHSKQIWYSLKSLSSMASKLGITRVGAIGVSLGPYKTLEDEKFVHKSLKSLEFLALRDNESYQEARSLQLPYKPIQASDLAMLLPKMKSESDFPVPTNPIIGISLCHYERFTNIPVKKEQERENNLLQGLKIFLNDKFRGTIRFLIFNDHGHYGDMEITQYFMNCLKSTNHKIEFFGYSNDPIFMWKKVAECSAFVSTRLHGCIFASAAKVPCISIEYHKKCSNFLDDINIEKKWRIGDMECSPKEFAVNLENLLLCDRKLFYPKRSHLMSLAEQNFLGPLDLKSH